VKIGVNLLLWTSRLGREHLTILRMLKALGYDGVEVPVFNGTPAHYTEIGRMVAGEGLAVAVAGTLKPGADPLSDDPIQRQAGADHLGWLVDCAHALRAEVIAGPFHQPLGQFSGQGPSGDEWERLVDSQRAMADCAGPGLRLAIEPLNRFECYALNTAAAAARLVAEVRRRNYGYLFDTFHAHIEERDPVAALQATLPAVSHFHVSENDRGTPGRGHAAIKPALRALKAAGYDRWISVEAFGQALPDIAAATKVWRPLFTSETDVVTEAIQLIRQIWTE
jgi:D-psicose/D-tagatose/L-ribulose 3-epimerase